MPVGNSISVFGGLMINYLPGFVSYLKRATLMRSIPLGKMRWEGEKLVKKLQTQANTSIHYTVDGGAIKPAGNVLFTEITGYRKFLTASAAVTDGILATASSTKRSAVKMAEFVLKSTLEMCERHDNFFFSRDGTGVVATLGATTSGAYITVSDGRGFHEGADYEIRAATAHNGYAIGDVITSFTVKYVQRALVSSTNEATVYLQASLGAANQITGDYIVWGSGDYSDWGRAITGLGVGIDNNTGTFQGVDCSLYPKYTSPVIDGGGTAFNMTPTIFRQMQAMLKQEQEDFKVPGGLLVYTSAWDAANIEAMYENAIRLTPDSKSVGFSGGLTFKSAMGEWTILSDHDVPYGTMFFINRNAISKPVQQEMDWRRSDGGGIFERSDKFLGYTATLVEISDLFYEERHVHGKIKNMKVTPYSAF